VTRWLILAVIALAAPAHADAPNKSAAEAEYAEGQRRYAAGDYTGASQRFVAAHALDPDPAYLYNAAQAYRFAKSCALAADYYRRFLAAAPGASNKDKVEAYIAEMDACTPKPTLGPEPKKDPVTDGLLDRQEPVREPEAPQPGRTQRIVGVAAAGLGLVAVGVGAYYTSRHGAYVDKTDELYERAKQAVQWTDPDEAEEKRLIAKTESAQLRATISFVAGGALVVGGVAAWMLSPKPEEPRLSIAPADGGAMAFGSFRF
jgi:tetratricopeptide (TPR) repeat protein